MNELPVAATWNVQQANELYGVDRWSNDLFSIRSDGDLSVHLTKEGQTVKASILDIVSGIRERGLETPLLLRFHDLLTERISKLNEAFHDAIEESNYRGHYRGVYPRKLAKWKKDQEGCNYWDYSIDHIAKYDIHAFITKIVAIKI